MCRFAEPSESALTLKLLQRQVAQQLGVNHATIANRETNGAQPTLKYMPAIIRFLRYNSLPPPSPRSVGERLVRCRTAWGLLKVSWRGEREPTGAFKVRAVRFLDTAEETARTAQETHSSRSGQ